MDKIVQVIKKIPYGTIPIVIAMAVIPLIVYYYEFEAHLSMMSWYIESDLTGDMFNYYKMEFLTALAGLMIALIIVGFALSKKYYFNRAMIPLAIYALFIILSTIFSDYQYFSLNGMDNHFETVYVLLSYCLLTAYSFWFSSSEKNIKFIIYGWIIGIAVMGLVGMFQISGHDLFATEFGKNLILSKDMQEIKNIEFTFKKGMVYLTLYNPNYVGFYAVLTIPVLSALFIFVKNKFVKMILFLLNGVIFLCLMGSGARNGMIALLCALLFMLVIFRKSLKSKWLGFLISYVSMIVIFVAFNALNGGMVTERLEEGFDVEADTSEALESIETNEDNVIITYNGNELVLSADLYESGYQVNVRDKDGNDIDKDKLETETISYELKDERFPFTISIGTVGGYYGFAVDIEGKTWCFSNQTEYKGYYFYTPYGKFSKIEVADSAVFTNYSKLASGRGYLWARTIPLLKDYALIGSGPDTFTVVFPQKDYVAASKMGYDKMTVTKPHDLYLQIGTQTGVVSLIAFLTLNLLYLLECLKVYWKNRADSFLEYIGMAFMIAIIGYLISGIINDSTITVAPIYWCMMGIGLAINRLVKKQREEIK